MRLPILRKEIRYRAGGLLALPVLAIAGGWAVRALAKQQDVREYESILASSFSVAVTLTCMVAGLSIGLWQVLAETRPGSWAFLRHRPVSTTRLFFGKLGAALLIYLLVAGVPLAGVVWWAATPGHFLGPWLWPMALPSLLDLLCGTVYVLAGMLIGLREARWFGSRLLPVGLALVCSAMTWFPGDKWVGLGAIAGAWLVFLPAVWGAMAYRGREGRQGWIGRTMTAVTLVPAMIAIPAMAGAMLMEMFRAPQLIGISTSSSYVLEGVDLFEKLDGRAETKSRRVVNDNGDFVKDVPYQPYSRLGTSAWLPIDLTEYGASLSFRSYRFAGSYWNERRWQDERRSQRWLYMHDAKYIVGYQRRQDAPAELLGYIGANGFTQNLADVVPFQAVPGPEWSIFDEVVEPGRVLSISLLERKCRTVFTIPRGERAASAGLLQVKDGYKSLWVVTTDKATYVVDEHQTVLLRQTHIGPEYSNVVVGASDDLKRFGLLYSRGGYYHHNGSKVFIRVAADGRVLSRTDVPGSPDPVWKSSPFEPVIEAVIMPPVLEVIGVIQDQPQKKLNISLMRDIALPGAICTAICVGLAFWLLRRAGERRGWTVFWLITVLLLGIGGVLLMLAMRQWPPRVRCGHCGRKSVTTGFACQHCGTAFPIPDPGAIAILSGIFGSSKTAIRVKRTLINN